MLGLGDKFAIVGLLAGACAILVVSATLQPAACGYGTHMQLGLPPCNFLRITHIPCPSCGMTTSFAYAARFRFLDALRASPFGVLAFLGTIAAIPTAAFMLLRRIPIWRITENIHFSRVLYTTCALYVLSWIFKIAELQLEH